MRHRIKGRHFNRPADQRKALYRSLVRAVIINERITTTEAKAKEARSLVEKLITYGKKGSIHNRRQAMSFLPDSKVVSKVFDDISPRYNERNGGYTRVLKIGNRKGDNAPMAILELV